MLDFANRVLIFPKMFLFVLFGFGFIFLGGRFSCDPFIHSGANARKVTLTTLTSQMNSFSVCLFFSFVVFFFHPRCAECGKYLL